MSSGVFKLKRMWDGEQFFLKSEEFAKQFERFFDKGSADAMYA